MTQSIIALSPRVRTIRLIQHPAFRGAPVQTERRPRSAAPTIRVASAQVGAAEARPAPLAPCAQLPVRPSAAWSEREPACLAA